MSTITFTMSEIGRNVTVTGIWYGACCGFVPDVTVWGEKGFVRVACRNPDCENHDGVFDTSRDIGNKWDKCRIRI